MTSNLPPGVTDNMIPGNRPEDMEWRRIFDDIDTDATDNEMTAQDVEYVWTLGLSMWKLDIAQDRTIRENDE